MNKKELKSKITNVVADYCRSNNIPIKGDIVKLKSWVDCLVIVRKITFDFVSFDVSNFVIDVFPKDENISETIVLSNQEFNGEIIRQVNFVEQITNSDE